MKYQSLYETLRDSALRFPDKVGLIDAQEEIAYKVLKERTDRTAGFLKQVLGMGPGCKIGVVMENCMYYVELIYAASKIGISVLLINVKLHEKEIHTILKDVKIGALAIQEKFWDKMERAVKDEQIQAVIFEKNLLGVTVCEEYTAAQARGLGCKDDFCVFDAEMPIAVLYTSGTSGKPKGVEISQRAVLETIQSYKTILKMNETEIGLLAVPIFHITGFSCILALFIYLGARLVMLPSFHSGSALEAFGKYGITHFHAVPTLFLMLINNMKDVHCLDSLRTIVCGGGYIEDIVVEKICAIANHATFHPAYGMTETAGGGVLFPEHYLTSKKRESAGKVMDNCRIDIMGEDGMLLPRGGKGQIVFGGAMVIDHYLHQKDPDCFINGWLLSGDVGYLDEDNYIYIIGRTKAMINRGGEKIYARFVEREILSHQNVFQCSVFPVKDKLFGEVPAAVIVPSGSKELGADAIRLFLSGKMQKTKIPQYIEFWKELPCTASGKVRISYLTELFNEKYAKGEV